MRLGMRPLPVPRDRLRLLLGPMKRVAEWQGFLLRHLGISLETPIMRDL